MNIEEQAPDTIKDVVLKNNYNFNIFSDLNKLKLVVMKNNCIVDTQSGFSSLDELSNYIRFIILLEENK